jgi:electron transport complex protein RnfC
LLAIIREAGIVGLGGAGFPSHIKLNPPPDKKIDTIFINAAECEPYLTTDHRVLLEETEEILMGFDILLHMFPEARGIIAIEDNKPDAVEKFNKLNKNERVTVMTLVTKYPQGAERQVVYACTGKEVPSGGLPLDVGCLVHNVDTVIAIRQAVVNGMPLMRKVITVTGGAASNPGNYEVRLGMTFSDLLEAVGGGFTSEPYKIVVGGPMMGVAQYTLDIPVIKISSALLLLTKEESFKPPSENCFRCGKCVDHCPMGLVPLDLNYYANKGDSKRFFKFNGLDCIWCACCSYICPAHRNLAQSIYIMRQEILDSR